MAFGKSAKSKPQVDQHHVEKTQKGVSTAGKILAVLTPLLLIAIIGLSVAPVAAIHEGWAKYSHDNIAFAPAGRLRILVGWLRFHSTVVPGQIQNKEVKHSALVLGAITIAWLLLSALTATAYLLLSCITGIVSKAKKSRTAKYGKGASSITQLLLTVIAPFIGVVCILLAIALYILLAVDTAIYTRNNFPGRPNYMAWPDWAFYLACAAGFFWLLLAPLAAMTAATAGASAGLEGKSADDLPQENRGMSQRQITPRQERDNATELSSAPPAYQNKTHPTPKAQPGQNTNSINFNDGYGNNNQQGYDTGNGHLDNVNGYVIDHNRHRGDLAEETYHQQGLV